MRSVFLGVKDIAHRSGRAQARAHKYEHQKASTRAKVERPLRVIRRSLGQSKVRFKELAKNTTHAITPLAPWSLWMARRNGLRWRSKCVYRRRDGHRNSQAHGVTSCDELASAGVQHAPPSSNPLTTQAGLC